VRQSTVAANVFPTQREARINFESAVQVGTALMVSLHGHFIRKTARSIRVHLMPKHFIVFAERFEHGAWKYWEHECDKEEIPALEDSAAAYAFSRSPSGEPLYIDYLRGAEYLFNVVYGRSGPAEEDTRVFGIRVDRILIAECETFTQYLEFKMIA
jgi:hypothetical protein